MQLEVPQYLAELNRAADVSLLDWDSPAPNTYDRTIGRVTLKVALNPRTGGWDWRLMHERSGLLTSGHSADRDVAQAEAIAYATNWVRNAMVGVLA